LQVGSHLTRQHLDVSRAKHPDRHSGIADGFQVGSLPTFIQGTLGANAAGVVEFREVEALAKDEDIGDDVAAAAGIGLIVAPGARVRVGAGYAIERSREYGCVASESGAPVPLVDGRPAPSWMVQLAVKRARPYSISWGIGVWNSSPFCMWRGMATSRPRRFPAAA